MSLLESKTFWASTIGLGCFVLGLLGYDTHSVNEPQLAATIVSVVAGLGYIFAILGRVMATKKIETILPQRKLSPSQQSDKKDVEL